MNAKARIGGSVLYGLLLALAGCTSPHNTQPGEPVSSVRPASDADVKGCKYLDDVAGTSAHYGVFAGRGITNTREEATLRAQTLGATHIVWGQPASGYGATSISAKAYRCPN